MRTVRRSTAFKKDYKRESAGQHGRKLDELLAAVVARLAADEPLPEANRDHPLSGAWKGYRDCHVRPDLLLIYSKPDAGNLHLARLGSHSQLF